jgi:hypothetical protein
LGEGSGLIDSVANRALHINPPRELGKFIEADARAEKDPDYRSQDAA